jgi:hypothetical protein
MSVEAVVHPVPRGWLADPRVRRVLRYALGSTIAMAIAMGVAWELSFLVPVLSLSFLGAAGPRPGFRKGFGFLAVIAAACLVGLWAIKYFLSYPFPFFAIFALLLLRLFYAKAGGASPFLITWLLIALLVLPLVAVQSPDLAVFIVRAIVLGSSVTLLVVWLTYALIPEPTTDSTAGAAAAAAGEIPPPLQRIELALTQTLVVVPVFVLFHVFEMTGGILILVFVALLSIQPGFAKNFKAGAALILGNLIGGLAAIVMFQLLTVVPEFSFLLVLTLLAGFLFGARLLSGDPKAPLFGMAYSTLLLIIGSTTSSAEGDAASKIYERIFQLMVAVAYVVTAFGVVERLRRARER